MFLVWNPPKRKKNSQRRRRFLFFSRRIGRRRGLRRPRHARVQEVKQRDSSLGGPGEEKAVVCTLRTKIFLLKFVK